MPVQLFNYSSQMIYSKTKRGVDGSTQYMGALSKSFESMRWEKKILKSLVKTVKSIPFIDWRVSMREDRLSDCKFGRLESYWKALCRIQSLPNWIMNAAVESLKYSSQLDTTAGIEGKDYNAFQTQTSRVATLAKSPHLLQC